MYKKYESKNTAFIIGRCIIIHSSFCVLDFLLFVCRPIFVTLPALF